MTMHARCILLAVALAIAPLGASLAQQNQAGGSQAQGGKSKPTGQTQQQTHKPQTAQVGAGTDADTTTGNSGPKKSGGGGKPPLPQAKLCDSYQGAVKQDCLMTVLRKQGQQSGQTEQGAGAGSQPKGAPKSGG